DLREIPALANRLPGLDEEGTVLEVAALEGAQTGARGGAPVLLGLGPAGEQPVLLLQVLGEDLGEVVGREVVAAVDDRVVGHESPSSTARMRSSGSPVVSRLFSSRFWSSTVPSTRLRFFAPCDVPSRPFKLSRSHSASCPLYSRSGRATSSSCRSRCSSR